MLLGGSCININTCMCVCSMSIILSHTVITQTMVVTSWYLLLFYNYLQSSDHEEKENAKSITFPYTTIILPMVIVALVTFFAIICPTNQSRKAVIIFVTVTSSQPTFKCWGAIGMMPRFFCNIINLTVNSSNFCLLYISITTTWFRSLILHSKSFYIAPQIAMWYSIYDIKVLQ